MNCVLCTIKRIFIYYRHPLWFDPESIQRITRLLSNGPSWISPLKNNRKGFQSNYHEKRDDS